MGLHFTGRHEQCIQSKILLFFERFPSYLLKLSQESIKETVKFPFACLKNLNVVPSRFPRDKARRKQWEVAVNREEDWSSTESSAVCSEHFDASDFYLTESGLRRLSCEAVPLHNISVSFYSLLIYIICFENR